MKSHIILLACFIIPLVCACEEDEGLNSHRLIKVTHTDGDGSEYDYYTEYSYTESKLTRILTYRRDDYGNWDESFLVEISYSENGATATRYNYDNGYQDEYSKSEYQVEGGRILEDHLYWWNDYAWENWAKWTYQYSGSDLISYDYFYSPEGVFELRGRGTYTYVDNKVMEFLYLYDDGETGLKANDKETFSHGDHGISQFIDYNQNSNGGWIYYYKGDYSYSGNQLYKVDYTEWVENTNSWDNAPYYTINYNYDNNGYLIQWFNSDGDKYVYEYEEGQGNAAYFYYDPEYHVYDLPAIKSARPLDHYIPYHRRSSHDPM